MGNVEEKLETTPAVPPETKKPVAPVQPPAKIVKPGELLKVMEGLKAEGYDYLNNLTAVDYPEYFEVVYHLFSYEETGKKSVIKCRVENKKDPQVPSVCSVWNSANWQEREVYDLMGVTFTGHPNLKRILLTDDFVGHPLRKDYQLDGEV